MATDPSSDFPAYGLEPVPDPCEDAATLQSKAERCRRLAAGISDRQTTEVLIKLAAGYEQSAELLKSKD